MKSRRRSSSKPSSFRGCRKVRLINKHELTELKSWISSVSKNNKVDEDEIISPNMNMKVESKESFYVACERMKERHINFLNIKHFKNQCYHNLNNPLLNYFKIEWIKF